MGFKDMVIHGNLTGVNELQIRLLRKLGYCVVPLKENNFDSNPTWIKKVQYLQNLLKESISGKPEM